MLRYVWYVWIRRYGYMPSPGWTALATAFDRYEVVYSDGKASYVRRVK